MFSFSETPKMKPQKCKSIFKIFFNNQPYENVSILTLRNPPKDALIRSENGQRVDSLQGPVASDNSQNLFCEG